MRNRAPVRFTPPQCQLQRLCKLALAAAVIVLLAALPSASASASTSGSPATSLPSGVSGLSNEQVEELLSDVTIGPGGAEVNIPQFAKVLAELPGITSLKEVSGLGGQAGLEQALAKGIEEFIASGGTFGELLEPGGLSPELQESLEGVIGGSLPIETLLGKTPEQILAEGLGSITLTELLDKLLGGASNPQQFVESLLGSVNPETAEEVLGSTLAGGPVSSQSVGELASSLGTTPESLAEALGSSPEQLPESAKALTAPLTSGTQVGLFDGLKDIVLGLLPEVAGSGGEEPPGGGGSGGKGGNGSNGGSGGAGNGGPGGSGTSSTLTFSLPATTTTTTTGTAAGSASKAASAGKVKIVKHSIKRGVATIVVQVPAAGKLTLHGNGLKTVHKSAPKAERVTLTTTLTKASTASLKKRRRHHRAMKVQLTASFAPSGAASSSASTTLSFR